MLILYFLRQYSSRPEWAIRASPLAAAPSFEPGNLAALGGLSREVEVGHELAGGGPAGAVRADGGRGRAVADQVDPRVP